jgi:hypothetical protein
MDYNRFLSLSEEFSKKIEEQHTLYLDSIIGYSILHERLLQYQEDMKSILGDSEFATPEFQDTCSTNYKHLSDKDFTPVSLSPLMTQGDVKERTKNNGRNYMVLGAQCLVSMYSYWEEYLRIEIGIAKGHLPKGSKHDGKNREILNEHVKNDFWGDIRYIRNSIVHNNCVANNEMKNCKIIKWFSPGTEIRLDYEKMYVIFLQFGYYRNELHSMSFPQREGYRIRLPCK